MAQVPECHGFIACSLDGFIARADGDIEWLTGLPVAAGEDGGYGDFIAGMDHILMGRGTWEKVRAFDPWPYALPVTVASRSLPAGRQGPVTLSPLPLRDILAGMTGRVYVDGGQILSALMRQGLMTRLTVTFAPVILGAGLPLFQAAGAHRLVLDAVRHWQPGFVQMRYSFAQ